MKLREGNVFSQVCLSVLLFTWVGGRVTITHGTLDLTIRLHPRHVPTCSMRTSLYRDPPPPKHVPTCPTWTLPYGPTQDTFQLVQCGPHCTETPPTCSNLFNLDLTIRPYPRHVPTCSTWTSLYMDPPNMFQLAQLGPHCTLTSPHTHTRCSNLLTMKPRLGKQMVDIQLKSLLLLVVIRAISILPDKSLYWGSWVVIGKWQLVTVLV